MAVVAAPSGVLGLPDHTQLPETDGTFVKNFSELPQSILLTDSLGPVLKQLHADDQHAIGQDSGIYWRHTDPPLKGCCAPDWYYVPNVPPKLKGEIRRSYVLWQERVPPSVVLEFASTDGSEERDRTVNEGKFWIYEQAVRASYYGIFEVITGALEVHRLVDGRFVRMRPNRAGRYAIEPLGVELGVWQGRYQNVDGPWIRWWDAAGNLLLTGGERAELERERAELERERAEQERKRAEQERKRAEQERKRAEHEHERAEHERERAEQQCERVEKLAAKLRALGIDPDRL